MPETMNAQFSDEEGNIYHLENETSDVLDPSGKPLSDGGDLSEASVKFTADETRKLPQSGGRFKAFCGSVLKFLSDLKTVAFSGSYNDLSDHPDIPSGAAADYGVANNDTTNRADMLVTAQVAYQHGREIDQLNSEFQAWFGVTEDGQRGWKEQGADTVHPFRSGIIFRNKPLYWSSYPNGYDTNIRRYNISEECPYYKKLTIDNLVVRALGTDRAYSIGYDPNSGYITVDQGFLWGNNGTCDIAIVYPLDNG